MMCPFPTPPPPPPPPLTPAESDDFSCLSACFAGKLATFLVNDLSCLCLSAKNDRTLGPKFLDPPLPMLVPII